MISSLAAATLAGLVLPSGAPAAVQTQSYTGTCQYVFIAPHQDDEFLTLGGGIRQHVTAHGGSKVCVVMMTDGQSSGVYGVLTKKGVKGQTFPGMTRAQFSHSRDLESWNALRHMGIPSKNIYLNDTKRMFSSNVGTLPFARLIDSKEKGKAPEFVDKTISYFGSNKHYKTMSDREPRETDHLALGKALRDSKKAVASKRFYLPPYYYKEVYESGRGQGITGFKLPSSDRTAIDRARNSFNVWNPSRKFYSIGYLSVKSLFDQNKASTIYYQHS